MKKKFYETPEAELFTVRFEGNMMQGSPYGTNGLQKGQKVSSNWSEWDDDNI